MRLVPNLADARPGLEMGQVALYAAQLVEFGRLLRALSQLLLVLVQLGQVFVALRPLQILENAALLVRFS